jgi:hypothetical protein
LLLLSSGSLPAISKKFNLRSIFKKKICAIRVICEKIIFINFCEKISSRLCAFVRNFVSLTL